MASVFTYDPDPPRVSSPWMLPRQSDKDSSDSSQDCLTPGTRTAQSGLLSEYGVTRLEAEPQEGPTEYKLHLLLRPRRTFERTSTTGKARTRSIKPSTPSPAASSQTRQQRLQHLTTQLLWRLQQSSPYHASSSKELALPRLPDDNVDLTAPIRLNKLVPGLEESRGALYEIGVSDDGTLIGLTQDEMDESITTLKVMAASLGCTVQVARLVVVGDCEWVESTELVTNSVNPRANIVQTGKLWVAEALVMPRFIFTEETDGIATTSNIDGPLSGSANAAPVPSRGSSTTPQLRVTFTGPTTSGKSSLLGTLSTGTLDNGRGMSRLSLLKHRHEVESGVTSSIAQELIGYKDGAILNYAHGNIESWVDIHDCAENGRLVFVSDSAGHPRYRHTALRGLVNWAPHWVILCISADGSDLVKAHLALSLAMDVPMAVVITKMDLASKTIVQRTLNTILTAIKGTGRAPNFLQPDQRKHQGLSRVPGEDRNKVQELLRDISDSENLTEIVPIVLTSAVKGSGIGLMHALLENLPLPPTPTDHDFVGMALNPEQPKCLFHIDGTFTLPPSFCALAVNSTKHSGQGVVASGYLRFGRLSVGDRIVVGPFQPRGEEPRGTTPEERASPSSFGTPLRTRNSIKNAILASAIKGEWHDAQIVSIRNVRLPVLALEAGQAGSIGLVFNTLLGEHENDNSGSITPPRMPKIRRGMILGVPSKHMAETGLQLQAASGFTAVFNNPEAETLAVGSFMHVYTGSARALARIRRVSRQAPGWDLGATVTEDIDDIFSLNEDEVETHAKPPQEGQVHVCTELSLELLNHRQWIELGSRVILLEDEVQDKSGLESFVGKVVEITD